MFAARAQPESHFRENGNGDFRWGARAYTESDGAMNALQFDIAKTLRF